MRPLAGGPLRRARSGRRLAGAKLKYTDMNSKYALPKDGGLIVDSAPSDIIRRYEKIPASVFEHESEGVGYVADRSFGLDPSHVHFLNLPFYETGGLKKAPLSQRDIDIIVKLLREIEPDQIYAAGDLADPHGTHRTCMEAVLGALEVAKDDAWLKNCHLWLYRGAWLEWDLGMVDMAVPLSPDELIKKRHAIYRHVSQKDIVPFPGSDSREFWQRAEERTQNTARLYDKLGMAEYQAIEVFVKMF